MTFLVGEQDLGGLAGPIGALIGARRLPDGGLPPAGEWSGGTDAYRRGFVAGYDAGLAEKRKKAYRQAGTLGSVGWCLVLLMIFA